MSGASDPQEARLGETVDGGFTVTPQDTNILQHHLDEFQNGDPSLRTQLIDRVMGELYRLRPVNTPFDKKDARNKIQKWFYNHYSHPRREYIKFTRRWSARNAFYRLNRDEVSDLAKTQSGLMPGHPQFLGALQNATTTLWNDLDDELQEEYMQAAKDWSTEAPPKHIQSRMASSMHKWIIQDFQSQLYRTCGIRSLVLTAYESEDHDLKICMDDVHSVLKDGKDFKEFCPDWKNTDIWQEWSKFGYKCFSQDTDEGVVEEDRENMTTKPISVHLDADRFPELPPTTSNDPHKTKIIQSMLREYCTAHIRFITGKKTPFISWGSLAVKPSSWVDAECTPDGFEWKDPSKIKVGEIFRLLDHWRGHIDRGLQGLVWAPSCPLLQDEEHAPTHGGKLRRPIALPEEYSDEEVFILPQSDDIEQHESDLSDHEGPYRSSPVHDPFEEGAMDDDGESHPDEYNSSPSHGGQPSTSSLSYLNVSTLDVAGPSRHYQGEKNRDEAIPKRYRVKGEWYIEIPEKPK
ncbi:hypothetical protein V8E53_001506 [Lactarius tabidus]